MLKAVTQSFEALGDRLYRSNLIKKGCMLLQNHEIPTRYFVRNPNVDYLRLFQGSLRLPLGFLNRFLWVPCGSLGFHSVHPTSLLGHRGTEQSSVFLLFQTKCLLLKVQLRQSRQLKSFLLPAGTNQNMLIFIAMFEKF